MQHLLSSYFLLVPTTTYLHSSTRSIDFQKETSSPLVVMPKLPPAITVIIPVPVKWVIDPLFILPVLVTIRVLSRLILPVLIEIDPLHTRSSPGPSNQMQRAFRNKQRCARFNHHLIRLDRLRVNSDVKTLSDSNHSTVCTIWRHNCRNQTVPLNVSQRVKSFHPPNAAER